MAEKTGKSASKPLAIVVTPAENDSRDLMMSPLIDWEKELTEVSESDIDFMNDAELATDPIDGNDPNVYSQIVGTTPFSFLG